MWCLNLVWINSKTLFKLSAGDNSKIVSTLGMKHQFHGSMLIISLILSCGFFRNRIYWFCESSNISRSFSFEQSYILGIYIYIEEWQMQCQVSGALSHPPLSGVSRTMSTLLILQSSTTLYQISLAFFWHLLVLLMP